MPHLFYTPGHLAPRETLNAVMDGYGFGQRFFHEISPAQVRPWASCQLAFGLGGNGLFNATFTVSLVQALEETVSVHYETRNGTALAGEDYQPVNGTLTFNPGERAKTVIVVLTADALPEADETFYLGLSNPSGGFIIRPE